MIRFNMADRSKYIDSLMMLYKELPIKQDKDILDGKARKVSDTDREARTTFANAMDQES